jgi:hypothetical protein
MCLKNLVTLIIGLIVPLNLAFSQKDSRFLLKIKAMDSFQRSVIADTGAAIEEVGDDYVVAIANFEERNLIKRKFQILAERSLFGYLKF